MEARSRRQNQGKSENDEGERAGLRDIDEDAVAKTVPIAWLTWGWDIFISKHTIWNHDFLACLVVQEGRQRRNVCQRKNGLPGLDQGKEKEMALAVKAQNVFHGARARLGQKEISGSLAAIAQRVLESGDPGDGIRRHPGLGQTGDGIYYHAGCGELDLKAAAPFINRLQDEYASLCGNWESQPSQQQNHDL